MISFEIKFHQFHMVSCAVSAANKIAFFGTTLWLLIRYRVLCMGVMECCKCRQVRAGGDVCEKPKHMVVKMDRKRERESRLLGSVSNTYHVSYVRQEATSSERDFISKIQTGIQ